MPNFLGSVKFTFIILICIVVASIMGTLIPQKSGETIMPQTTIGKIMDSLQLNNIYHSYWYTLLLLLFCANLILCSTKNILGLLRIYKINADAVEKTELDKLAFYSKFEINQKLIDSGTLHFFTHKVLMRKLFYRIRYSNPKSNIYYFERGWISRFGPSLTHASIVIIVMGVIIVGLWGFKFERKIPVGSTIDVPNADFRAKAENFRIEYYPDTKIPKQYITELTIIENGNSVFTKDVMVNHPLKYKGIKFIQYRYGLINTVGIELKKKIPNTSETNLIGEFNIEEGSTIAVPNTSLKISFLSFLPDFVIDENNYAISRSSELRNPAVYLELFDRDQSLGKSWRFLKFPSFDMTPKSDYSLQFVSMYPAKEYTELQIIRDPGISVIWVGSFLMIIGFVISFFFSHKKLWIKISTENDILYLEAGGTSYKNKSGFDKENKMITKLLEK